MAISGRNVINVNSPPNKGAEVLGSGGGTVLTMTGTTETSLASITIPAGTLSVGDNIRISTLWDFGKAVSATDVPRVRMGNHATALTNQIVFAASVTTTLQTASIYRLLNVTSATTATMFPTGSTTGLGSSGAGNNVISTNFDITTEMKIVLSGDGGDATNVTTLNSYVIELIKGV